MQRPREKTPHPELTFVEGPRLSDASTFERWFREAASRKPPIRVRLPVMIQVDRRLGVHPGAARVSVSSSGAGTPIRLTDRMGIPLSDHLQTHCPADADDCGLWLEGYPALADGLNSPFDPNPSGVVFEVVRVVGGFVDGELSPSTVGLVASS